MMKDDAYNNFAELKMHEWLNKDYKISFSDVGSPITVIAPHGGKIEPKTSDLTKRIAGKKYNYYCFEGIKPKNNGRLHITSHNFDEPTALTMVSRSNTVIAIHACTDTSGTVYLGGLDGELKTIIAHALEARSIGVSMEDLRFQGLNPNNICNRGTTKKGVQLEISRDLRDDIGKIEIISVAVAASLS